MSDDRIQDDFGFDDGDAWIARAATAQEAPALGRLGPFELLAEAGRGGQGVVYRARDSRTGEIVALKRMVAGCFATPEHRLRFERELETARRLEHRGIVGVRGCEMIEGQPTLVMDWIEGVPITTWARGERGSAPLLSERLEAIIALGDAVHHVHREGVVHRDLKPSNVLVDRKGAPRLLDLGLAKLVDGDESLSRSDQFVGSLPYAAPERIDGAPEDDDLRGDVYALGAMLYEVATGRPPFAGDSMGELLRSIRRGFPPAPSTITPEIDRELDAITLKALARDPRARYASVAALAADLRLHLAGEPVLALPSPAAQVWARTVHRHRQALIASVVVAVLALAFGIYGTMLADEAAAAREHAVTAEARRLRAWSNAWRVVRFLQSAYVPAESAPLPLKADLSGMLAAALARIDGGELDDNLDAKGEVLLVLARVQSRAGLREGAERCFRRGCENLERAEERSERHLIHALVDWAGVVAERDPDEALAILERAQEKAVALEPRVPRVDERVRAALEAARSKRISEDGASDDAGPQKDRGEQK